VRPEASVCRGRGSRPYGVGGDLERVKIAVWNEKKVPSSSSAAAGASQSKFTIPNEATVLNTTAYTRYSLARNRIGIAIV